MTTILGIVDNYINGISIQRMREAEPQKNMLVINTEVRHKTQGTAEEGKKKKNTSVIWQ